MLELLLKAVRLHKRCYANGGWDYLESFRGDHGIARAIHDAKKDPTGPAAQWLQERNERIERYRQQAETGPLHFER